MTASPDLPEHAALRPLVDALRSTADLVGTAGLALLRRRVRADVAALDTRVLPHLAAEDEVLYPALQRALHSPRATVGMEHDHSQIRQSIHEMADVARELEQVDEVGVELATRIRRVWYGLYALLANHFDKEELLYLPHLRREFDEASMAELLARMDRVVELS